MKNMYIREICVATVRAQAGLKRENILRAIEQAEMPFAWRHRVRTEREYLRRRSWNEQYYETFALLEGEPGAFARSTNWSYADSRRVY